MPPGTARSSSSPQALRRATRTSDVVARLGGEEFAVLAPETDEQEGFLLAERLRAEVKATFARQPENMTVSCGVASFPVHGITAGRAPARGGPCPL